MLQVRYVNYLEKKHNLFFLAKIKKIFSFNVYVYQDSILKESDTKIALDIF